MTRTARIIAAPRWRHFVPQGESINVKVPFYESKRDSNGKIIVEEKFRIDYVAGEIASEGYTMYQLPAKAKPKDMGAITVSFDDVVQDNVFEILYYERVDDSTQGRYGFRIFFIDNQNRLCYQRVDQTGVNRAPAPGTKVRIDIVNGLDAENMYVRIPIAKKWLIQGANPIDPNIITPDGTGSNEFQGGYRCTLKLISRAAHGHARISDDKLALEYRPDMGYLGVDSFAYRLVNALGQESPAYCVRVDVGTNTLPTTPEKVVIS